MANANSTEAATAARKAAKGARRSINAVDNVTKALDQVFCEKRAEQHRAAPPELSIYVSNDEHVRWCFGDASGWRINASHELLPRTHAAQAHLADASTSLASIGDIWKAAYDGSDGSNIPAPQLGSSMLVKVIRAGQALERAGQAVGGRRAVGTDYLDDPDHDPCGLPQADSEKLTDLISNLFGEIYALTDIALRFEKTPFAVTTTRKATNAFTKTARRGLKECIVGLSDGNQARGEIEGAITALNLIDELMSGVINSSGDFTVPAEIVSAGMHKLVVRAARAMERAEIALGERSGTAGYLDDPDLDPTLPCTESEEHHG